MSEKIVKPWQAKWIAIRQILGAKSFILFSAKSGFVELHSAKTATEDVTNCNAALVYIQPEPEAANE